jgi:hypothetical protein
MWSLRISSPQQSAAVLSRLQAAESDLVRIRTGNPVIDMKAYGIAARRHSTLSRQVANLEKRRQRPKSGAKVMREMLGEIRVRLEPDGIPVA